MSVARVVTNNFVAGQFNQSTLYVTSLNADPNIQSNTTSTFFATLPQSFSLPPKSLQSLVNISTKLPFPDIFQRNSLTTKEIIDAIPDLQVLYTQMRSAGSLDTTVCIVPASFMMHIVNADPTRADPNATKTFLFRVALYIPLNIDDSSAYIPWQAAVIGQITVPSIVLPLNGATAGGTTAPYRVFQNSLSQAEVFGAMDSIVQNWIADGVISAALFRSTFATQEFFVHTESGYFDGILQYWAFVGPVNTPFPVSGAYVPVTFGWDCETFYWFWAPDSQPVSNWQFSANFIPYSSMIIFTKVKLQSFLLEQPVVPVTFPVGTKIVNHVAFPICNVTINGDTNNVMCINPYNRLLSKGMQAAIATDQQYLPQNGSDFLTTAVPFLRRIVEAFSGFEQPRATVKGIPLSYATQNSPNPAVTLNYQFVDLKWMSPNYHDNDCTLLLSSSLFPTETLNNSTLTVNGFVFNNAAAAIPFEYMSSLPMSGNLFMRLLPNRPKRKPLSFTQITPSTTLAKIVPTLQTTNVYFSLRSFFRNEQLTLQANDELQFSLCFFNF